MSEVAQAALLPHDAMTWLFSSVFVPPSWLVPPRGTIGSRQFVMPVPRRVGLKFHPVNTRVNSFTCVCVYVGTGCPCESSCGDPSALRTDVPTEKSCRTSRAQFSLGFVL